MSVARVRLDSKTLKMWYLWDSAKAGAELEVRMRPGCADGDIKWELKVPAPDNPDLWDSASAQQ